MAIILSQFATRVQNTVNADAAGKTVANDFFVDLLATDLVAGNVIDLGILPAGNSVSNVQLMCDKLDSNGTPAITLDVGLMSGEVGVADAARTVGQELFAGSNNAQSGTAVATPATRAALTIAATKFDRSIGVKIVTAPATAAAGRIRARVFVYATDSNIQY